jgi:hypothetical protein
VKLRPILSLFLGLCAVCLFGFAARAGDITLLGSERIVFSTFFGDSTGVNYPCGRIARTATGPNYSVDNEPYFDGPVAPISYVEGSIKKLRFNASLGYRNYRILSTLNADSSFTNGTLDCTPVYTAGMSSDNTSFNWAEWLYGTFRDVSTGRVYAIAYNEYYGGTYYSGPHNTYSALGMVYSTNNGATFQKIQSPPNHVIVKAPYLWPNGGGLGFFGGILKSPLDQLYYVGVSGGDNGTPIIRTNNLDDPTSWRAWDGSGFNMPTTPLNSGYVGISVNPLYLGYSDYFKKYIAVTTGNVGGDPSRGGYQIVYNLSDDMVNWGPARKIMDNPACPSSGDCGSIASYPAMMDPSYLSDTNDSTKASNGMNGISPYVTYIKNYMVPSQYRQQFAAQRISFDQVVFNRMDNFSMRGVVDGGGRSLVMGFIMQGSESKQFAFRGLGPSLPNVFSYPRIGNPRISLYDGGGNLIASNAGWRSLSGSDQNVLISKGINPSSDAEAAIVATIAPGNYSLIMDNGYGIGVIEAYDFSPTAESKIANVSVRGYGQPADGALTMGFISRGGQQAIVRGTGMSSLAPFGFSPVIPDPYLTVYNGSGGTIISNNDWGTDPNAGVIQSYGLAPGNSAESATMFSTQATLPSRFSVYTVQLQGTGFGLLDLYNVNAN